jgi:hypothetical protein
MTTIFLDRDSYAIALHATWLLAVLLLADIVSSVITSSPG